jgi:hypothetical protein
LTLLVVAAALTIAGCGGDDQRATDVDGGATSTAQAGSTTATGGETTPRQAPEAGRPEDGGSAPGTAERAAVPQRAPGRGCLRGRYLSSSFAGKRSFNSPVGAISLSGRGHGLALDFRGTVWTMRGIGRRPMRGRALGIEGTLKIRGSARGRLTRARGERLRFRRTGSRGSVTLAALGQTIELPVSVVAPAVLPDGRARVTCRGDRLRIDSASGVLRLTRP